MKIFVATSKTQGQRSNDFIACGENEIVNFGSMCDRSKADDSCGCARAMVGLNSRKATTTVKVIDSDMTLNDLIKLLHASDIEVGFGSFMDEATELKAAKQLVELADQFEIGDIIEPRKKGRGMTFGIRTLKVVA